MTERVLFNTTSTKFLVSFFDIVVVAFLIEDDALPENVTDGNCVGVLVGVTVVLNVFVEFAVEFPKADDVPIKVGVVEGVIVGAEVFVVGDHVGLDDGPGASTRSKNDGETVEEEIRFLSSDNLSSDIHWEGN